MKNDKNRNKSLGEIPKGVLILGAIIIIIVVIAIIFWGIRKTARTSPQLEASPTPTPMPVYEVVLGNVKFNFIETEDLGNVLKGKDSIYPDWQKDLTTTERFIKVVIGATNIGKEYVKEYSWDVGEMIDKEGRKFYPVKQARPWLPPDNQCGVLLKPAFVPRECTKIYEVSKLSSGFKIRVFLPKKGGLGGKEGQEGFVDLDI